MCPADRTLKGLVLTTGSWVWCAFADSDQNVRVLSYTR